ncbi:hypothetical protein BDR26DRAFT_853688 [Obelidium mucronatum]|nr:hypothetical protein BDR26DRAFT_853688 [Obelidium mucronatum]
MSCFHCRQTALEIETLRQAALDEINIYRKLLRLPPQSTLTSHNRTTPSGKRLSLQTMPTEILDRIASFVGSESIMQLCHSLPELKHISRTIHDVAMAFPSRGVVDTVRMMMRKMKRTTKTTSRARYLSATMYSIYNLTSLLSRYGGSARFSGGDVAYLDNILPLLPKHKLKESKVSLPSEWTASARTNFLEECVLPNMRNLKELFLHNHPPSVALKSVRCIDTRCVDPQEISDLVHHLPQSSLTYVAFEADIFLNEEQTRHLAIGWKIICHREFESTVKVEWFK